MSDLATAESHADIGQPNGTLIGELELSVVMPCLNEAETVANCIRKAQSGIAELGLNAEIIVVDNGSVDGSQKIARDAGAKVIDVKAVGYGSALMGGIAAAQGRYIIMGDSDDSYDFREIGGFITRLREGYQLVQGCRLPRGGGRTLPGAMPFLHRWWGNPMFSALARWWFAAPIHDVYCGLRGFTKELYQRLDQRCVGMEFATEMIIKATLQSARICEVPITLHPDGREAHRPHLKTFRDGWRTLRFFLLFSPRWLFLMPGLSLIGLGLIGYAIALPKLTINGITFDAHTLLFASLWLLCGYQLVVFAIFTKTFAINAGLMPMTQQVRQFFRVVTLERGLIASFVMLICGMTLLFLAVNRWRASGFGRLDYSETMRELIPGATLTMVAVQTIFSSFFVSLISLNQR
jgi:glycosyltransferase involved in cell wall biosynthesis